jgi:hypothetical protein
MILPRFNTSAAECEWAVFNLQDSPWSRATWSGASQALPGLRQGTNRLWCPAKRRWLLSIEVMAAFGMPSFVSLAAVGLVRTFRPEVGSDSVTRRLLGNSMHIPSVGVALTVALASCSLVEDAV